MLQTPGSHFQINSLQIEVSGSLFIPQKILRILDRLGLNFHAINLKFAQIVAFYKAYNLCNFQLDTFKIKAWPVKNAKA